MTPLPNPGFKVNIQYYHQISASLLEFVHFGKWSVLDENESEKLNKKNGHLAWESNMDHPLYDYSTTMSSMFVPL